MPIVFTRGH